MTNKMLCLAIYVVRRKNNEKVVARGAFGLEGIRIKEVL